MEKRVAIIGAGTSGLLACKYILEKGLNPIVFEAKDGVGGLWNHTIESTKLQNSKESYQFTDFPWPASVQEVCPTHTQVLEYLKSYAQHFGIIPYIKFNSKVIDIDYVGKPSEEMESWDLWGGTSKPFCSKGKWHVVVQDTKCCSTEVVIICVGIYCLVPCKSNCIICVGIYRLDANFCGKNYFFSTLDTLFYKTSKSICLFYNNTFIIF